MIQIFPNKNATERKFVLNFTVRTPNRRMGRRSSSLYCFPNSFFPSPSFLGRASHLYHFKQTLFLTSTLIQKMRRFHRIPYANRGFFSSIDSSPPTKTKALFFSSSTPRNQKTKYQLPKRIILLRHGESLGNVDDTAYSTIPDWKIPLTRR